MQYYICDVDDDEITTIIIDECNVSCVRHDKRREMKTKIEIGKAKPFRILI